MQEVALQCQCGSVTGHTLPITANTGSRLVCHCDDCQAFAHFLKDDGRIMNEHGGIDVFQMPVSYVKITQGLEEVRCMKLTPKGSFRWFTECCKTPIGVTMGAGVPFIGLAHNFMHDAGCRDKNLGPVLGFIQTKFASTPLPASVKQSNFPIGLMMRSLFKVISWKLKGLNKPSPFFDNNGMPISTPLILNKEP